MRQTITVVTLAAILAFVLNASVALAQDRINHFMGKPTENIEQARINLSEYNRKMSNLLAAKLTDKDMVEIHHITYTLENALAHMAGELKQLQENLEKIHIASEHNDSETVRAITPNYLLTSGQLFN